MPPLIYSGRCSKGSLSIQPKHLYHLSHTNPCTVSGNLIGRMLLAGDIYRTDSLRYHLQSLLQVPDRQLRCWIFYHESQSKTAVWIRCSCYWLLRLLNLYLPHMSMWLKYENCYNYSYYKTFLFPLKVWQGQNCPCLPS